MDAPESLWDLARSPFKFIVGTNYAPSFSELAKIKAFLAEPLRARAQLESELCRLEALLVKSKEYIEAHQALTSPIRQLPSETLAEIFIWCLPTDGQYSVRSLKQAPLIFTMICRTWRSVALNTPRLWSSIHIYLPPHLTADAFSERTAGIIVWLKRSGSLPLSISLHGRTTQNTIANPGIDESLVKENMTNFFRLLMQLSDRIMDLSLSLSRADFLVFDALSPSHFPALTSLALRDANHHEGIYGNADGDPRELSFTSLLQRMPRLKRLKIRDFLPQRISVQTLRVQSLTGLDLSASEIAPAPGILVNISQALDLLSLMPRLQFVRLIIIFRIAADEADSPLSTAHLDQLQEMRVAFPTPTRARSHSDSQAQMASFFDRIQCPSLKTLSISWEGLSLAKIPFRGLPLHAVETLNLHLSLKPETLSECLSLFPNVTTLHMRVAKCRSAVGNNIMAISSLRDTDLAALTLSDKNPTPLCPRLQRFHYIVKPLKNPETFSTAALTDFITSRADALEYCDMFFMNAPLFTDQELDRLREVKRGGMRIQIHAAKADPMRRLDMPNVGLVPWWQNQPPLRPGYDESDMEGPYGTDVIV